jgi:membrane protein implicated in regulation of membrane protease activity
MVDMMLVSLVSLGLVGFVLLIISAFFGGDADAGDIGDMGADLGVDVGGVSPLSIPAIATFMATFGSFGTVMHLSGSDTTTTLVVGAGVGVVSFVGIYLFMNRFLGPSQATSSYNEKEYEGKTGTVTETINETGLGAIAVTIRGARAVISARGPGVKIPIGTEVLVRRVNESVATVEEIKQA